MEHSAAWRWRPQLGWRRRRARQLTRQEGTAFGKQILCTFSSTMTGSFKIDYQKRSGEYSQGPAKRAASPATLCRWCPRARRTALRPGRRGGGDLPCQRGFLSPRWLQPGASLDRRLGWGLRAPGRLPARGGVGRHVAHPGQAGRGFLERPDGQQDGELEATGLVSRKTENVQS